MRTYSPRSTWAASTRLRACRSQPSAERNDSDTPSITSPRSFSSAEWTSWRIRRRTSSSGLMGSDGHSNTTAPPTARARRTIRILRGVTLRPPP